MAAEEGRDQSIRERTHFLCKARIGDRVEYSVKHVFKLLGLLLEHAILIRQEIVHHVLIVNWEIGADVEVISVALFAKKNQCIPHFIADSQ